MHIGNEEKMRPNCVCSGTPLIWLCTSVISVISSSPWLLMTSVVDVLTLAIQHDSVFDMLVVVNIDSGIINNHRKKC